jgi:predicted  nucleic acid-binding Zn-ribbon protein
VKLDEKLNVLLMIQSIDTKFDNISREKEETPKEIEKLKEGLDLLDNTVEQDLSTVEELKKERRKVERELEEIDLKFKNSKLRLNEVKSNREYQAVLKEIEDLKDLTFQKEETVIKWMEEIEIQEKKCADNTVRREESQEEYKSKEKAFSQRIRELDKEVQSLNEKRVQLSPKIDEDLLRRYNGFRSHLKGRVVVPVIDGVCQECHLGIPPQQYNELIKGDSMQSCPHCSRIIYWGDDGGI